MPTFTYEGPSGTLIIAGIRMKRGQEVHVSNEVALRVADHPDVHEVTADKKPKAPAKTGAAKPDALAERQALVARAKELGIPAKGKSPELAAAIAVAEADDAAQAADEAGGN